MLRETPIPTYKLIVESARYFLQWVEVYGTEAQPVVMKNQTDLRLVKEEKYVKKLNWTSHFKVIIWWMSDQYSFLTHKHSIIYCV